MGKPTAVARRGANGEVEYEMRNEPLEKLSKDWGTTATGQSRGYKWSRQSEQRAKAAALNELHSREEAEAQARTAAMYGAASSYSPSGQGTSTYTEGNPGQSDSQSQGDVDLSTSDTTRRRRGGYRRDAGISI